MFLWRHLQVTTGVSERCLWLESSSRPASWLRVCRCKHEVWKLPHGAWNWIWSHHIFLNDRIIKQTYCLLSHPLMHANMDGCCWPQLQKYFQGPTHPCLSWKVFAVMRPFLRIVLNWYVHQQSWVVLFHRWHHDLSLSIDVTDNLWVEGSLHLCYKGLFQSGYFDMSQWELLRCES